jgi:hypothetical protein
MPTKIHPAPIIAAPSHQRPPTASRKIIIPNSAVARKFADVLVMDTFTVDGPAVRARVKRAHIMMLQRTLRPRQAWSRLILLFGYTQYVRMYIFEKCQRYK